MHFVIMGSGRVGAQLTIQLSRAGHSVSIIDKRRDAFDRLPPGFDARTVVGYGFDRETLEEAGIKEADAFVAVSNGDNSNIVSARIAREHYHVPRVVARIYDPRRADIYERLDIPTVATVRWAARQIQFLLFHGKEELRETLGGGEVFLVSITAPPHLVGQPVSTVDVPGQVEVVAVGRGGTGFLPTPESTFQRGDVMDVVVAKDAMGTLDEALEPPLEE